MQVGDNGFHRLSLPPPDFEMPVSSLEDRRSHSQRLLDTYHWGPPWSLWNTCLIELINEDRRAELEAKWIKDETYSVLCKQNCFEQGLVCNMRYVCPRSCNGKQWAVRFDQHPAKYSLHLPFGEERLPWGAGGRVIGSEVGLWQGLEKLLGPLWGRGWSFVLGGSLLFCFWIFNFLKCIFLKI